MRMSGSDTEMKLFGCFVFDILEIYIDDFERFVIELEERKSLDTSLVAFFD